MLKVLHVIHSLEGGGAERQLSLLCEHSRDDELEHITFCIDASESMIEEKRRIIRYVRRKKFDLGIFRAIASTVDKVRPDIVHAWLPPVVTIPALSVGAIKGVPVIVSYRSVMRIRRALDCLEYLCAWLFSSGVVSNIRFSLCSRPYQWLYKKKGGVLIRNAISIPVIASKPPLSQDKDRTLRILYVGRLAQEKNWQCLLEALVRLGEDIRWTLAVCGDGRDANEFLRVARQAGLNSRISMLGYRRDVYDIMKSSDVLVLPSWYEGMSNVVIEALAIGLPAIISDIPAHRELLDGSNAAILFPPDAPKALARILVQVYEHPEKLHKITRNGRFLADQYTVEKMVSSYSKYYRSVGRRK